MEFLFTIEEKFWKIFTKSLFSLLIIIVKLLARSHLEKSFCDPKQHYFVNEQPAVGHIIQLQVENQISPLAWIIWRNFCPQEGFKPITITWIFQILSTSSHLNLRPNLPSLQLRISLPGKWFDSFELIGKIFILLNLLNCNFSVSRTMHYPEIFLFVLLLDLYNSQQWNYCSEVSF